MTYTDPDTVRLALSPGGDGADTGSAAYLDDVNFDAAISDATDEVNAKLASRYPVPFDDPAPDLVATITTTIAGYLATLTARGGDPMPAGDPVLLRYQRAEQLLAQLQSGQMALGVASPAATTAVAVRNPLDGDLFAVDDFPIEAPIPWAHRITCE